MVSEKTRLRMLFTKLRFELSCNKLCVDHVRLIGTQVEVLYTVHIAKRLVLIKEGCVGGNIMPLLTCEDDKFEAAMKKFVEEYSSLVDDCIKQSLKKKLNI